MQKIMKKSQILGDLEFLQFLIEESFYKKNQMFTQPKSNEI